MMIIDLRPFLAHSPRGAALAEDLPDFPMPDVVAPLSDEERAGAEATLRQVAALVADTPGAVGSMRCRLGIVVDCLIAVADALEGDVDLEEGHDAEIVCEDEGAQCDDEGERDDNRLADEDGRAEQFSGTQYSWQACE